MSLSNQTYSDEYCTWLSDLPSILTEQNDELRSSLEAGLVDAENQLLEEQLAREEREQLDALENARVEALLALRKTCKEWVCYILLSSTNPRWMHRREPTDNSERCHVLLFCGRLYFTHS